MRVCGRGPDARVVPVQMKVRTLMKLSAEPWQAVALALALDLALDLALVPGLPPAPVCTQLLLRPPQPMPSSTWPRW